MDPSSLQDGGAYDLSEGNVKRRKIVNFRDPKVWKLGKEIVLGIYRATALFPKDEVYGLTAQMRRTWLSIPSNVAGGFNRAHNKEYRQFLYVALGSSGDSGGECR